MERKRPILSVRPQFDTALAMVQALIALVVGFLPVTIIAGTIFYLLLNIIGLGRFVSASGIYGFFLLLSAAGIPAVYYEMRRRAYRRTAFNFYDDHIDFQYFHFLINRRRGRVRYEDITDITQQASALQEQRRLTNIYLYVPTLDYMQQRGFAGLVMPDLPLTRGYMNQVMDIIDGTYAQRGQQPPAPEQGQQASQQPVQEPAAAPAAATGAQADGK